MIPIDPQWVVPLVSGRHDHAVIVAGEIIWYDQDTPVASLSRCDKGAVGQVAEKLLRPMRLAHRKTLSDGIRRRDWRLINRALAGDLRAVRQIKRSRCSRPNIWELYQSAVESGFPRISPGEYQMNWLEYVPIEKQLTGVNHVVG